MPIMDGFQATKLIRDVLKERGSDQPLISALTAYTTENFETMSADAGMDRFLTKPLNMEKLNEVMQEAGLLLQH